MTIAGVVLRDARRRAQMTQRELADLGGTSAPTISAYETGAKEPRVGTWLRLLDATGTGVQAVPWQPASNRLTDLLCRRYADLLELDPTMIDAARMVLPRMRGDHVAEWDALLDLGVDVVVGVLTSTSPGTSGLKSDAPFALLGLVEDAERAALVRRAYGS